MNIPRNWNSNNPTKHSKVNTNLIAYRKINSITIEEEKSENQPIYE